MSSQEEAIGAVADYLHGHVLWDHPHTQEQVIPPPTIASVLGQMFGALFNPNLLWDAYSHQVAQAEVELTAMCAGLVGYDPAKAGGVSTFGGTGTELYGVKIGVEKAQPGAFREGVRHNLKVACSDVSHRCRLNVAAWLGLGTDSVVTVPTDGDNAMSLPGLPVVRHAAQQAFGCRPGGIRGADLLFLHAPVPAAVRSVSRVLLGPGASARSGRER